MEVHSVEMDDSHREAYNVLYNSARAAFKAALAMGESEVGWRDFFLEKTNFIYVYIYRFYDRTRLYFCHISYRCFLFFP